MTQSPLGMRSKSHSIASGVCAPSHSFVVGAPLEPAREAGRRRRPRSRGRGTPPQPRARPRSAPRCRAGGRPTPARRARRSRPALRRRASPARSPRASRRGRPCARAPTFVRRTTGASMTFVASSRPPRPASIAAASTPCAANSASAAAVSASNCVAPMRSAAARTRPTARSKPSASVSSRSSQPETCGDVYAPTRKPSVRSSAAIVRVAVDFPFVPTTCTRAERALRVAELLEQGAHPPEPELLRPRRERRDPGCMRPHRREC